MPRKKKTREEILEKAKIARRKRYENIKSDPVQYALQKEKEHQRYLRRKEKKQILSIGEMTPRAKRSQRKKWRENFKNFYQRKLLRNRGIELMNANTPSCSDTEDNIEAEEAEVAVVEDPQPSTAPVEEPAAVVGLKKKVRRLRYIMLQKTKEFKNKINSLEKKVENYKKYIIRLKKRLQSPNSKINELLKDKSKLPEAKKKILFGDAMKKTLENNYKHQTKKGKKEFSDGIIGDKSILKSHKVLTEIKKFSIREKKNTNVKSDQHYQIVKENIQKFYERDDVSRMTAGRKETITRDKVQKQKRYLLDTLKNLHKIFENEYCKVSYSFFCKQRPFWVLIPDVNDRDTCMCKIHANIELLINSLHKRRILSEKTSNDVIKSLCCLKTECLLKRCEECRNKILNYLEFDNEDPIKFGKWERKKTTYLSKGMEKEKWIIDKIEVTRPPKEAIAELEKNISGFLKHEGIRRWQFSAINDLKNNLKDHEAIIHIDFSENYALKYASEVQAFHFGGSRDELTLHTAVIYHVKERKCTAKSFCTVSENLRHDAAAVWAHIVPLLEYVQTLSSKITTLHFLSDSPSSQYRNKTMFFIITKLYWYISSLERITWNYSESGHGKGAADGVGGTLKRTADAAVAKGKDIANLDSFVQVITSNTQNIEVKVVDKYQIYEKDLLIPKTDLRPLKGTLNVHQVIWHKATEELVFREASCFVCIDGDCSHTKLIGKYTTQNISNKENISLHDVSPNDSPKVIIHSNILLKTAPKRDNEVTRLTDILPDNKLHLNPDVDINEMAKEYSIPNATASFSGYFEDFVLSNQNISNVCENYNLEDSVPPKPTVASRKRFLRESDSDSDTDLDIFPKKKYFAK